MSSASKNLHGSANETIVQQTLHAVDVAKLAAAACAEGLASGSSEPYDRLRAYEDELDTIDHDINEDVTAAITKVNAEQARELLACLKFILELERIGDLLLNVMNRASIINSRLDQQDAKDLIMMASILEKMLSDVHEAFSKRNLEKTLLVLRADAELDRIRNLVFMRHVENRENQVRQESFHVVFMTQTLERAGDHVKNLAEEVCHMVTGQSVRHLLRSKDKSYELLFVDWMRKQKRQ
jgi:phosphate transport system protein